MILSMISIPISSVFISCDLVQSVLTTALRLRCLNEMSQCDISTEEKITSPYQLQCTSKRSYGVAYVELYVVSTHSCLIALLNT